MSMLSSSLIRRDEEAFPLSVRTRGLLALVRAPATVTQAVLVAFLAFCNAGRSPTFFPILLAASSYLLLSAAGFTINDYFDADIDAINKPKRPIPAGVIKPRVALGLFGIALGGSMLLAWLVGGVFAILTIPNSILISAYSVYFKRHGGLTANILMGIYATALVLSGLFVLGRPSDVLVVSNLSLFLYMVGAQIIMCVEDLEGDRKQGARTLPVMIGVSRSLQVGLALLAIGLVMLTITFREIVELPAALVIAGLNAVLFVRLIRTPTPCAAGSSRLLMALSMVLMVVIFILRTPLVLGAQ
jgi:geranylgeranylglycerol-phosphate geranylgeranyltransferase